MVNARPARAAAGVSRSITRAARSAKSAPLHSWATPFCNTVCVDFKSAYAHGFARIAACTLPIAIGDPATNAETVLTEARECHDEGVAVAIFSELCLTGYSVDDLFLQDTLLEAVEAGDRDDRRGEHGPASGARRRSAAAQGQPGLQLCRGDPPRQRSSGWRPSRSSRPIGSSTRPAGSRRGRTSAARRIVVDGESVPFGRDLIFRSTDVPGLALFVEICEDMWVPIPPSAYASLAGATVLANLSGSPDHHRARRGPPPARPVGQLALLRGVRLCRRRSGGVDDRPVVGRADDDLRVRWAARRVRALPRRPPPLGRRRRPRPDPAGAHAAGHLRRQRPLPRTS